MEGKQLPRAAGDEVGTPFREHYSEATWSVALKQLVCGPFDPSVHHPSLQL